MKKIILSTSVVLLYLVYAFQQHFVPSGNSAPASTAQNFQNNTSQPVLNQQGKVNKYKDGTYTGGVVNAFYGNVQVQATIKDGQINDVSFLDYPHDRGTSIAINSQAMPDLKSEAIQAQSANVEIITGATQTSEAFVQSLQQALSQSKI